MIIVAIHWKIKPEPDKVENFLKYWKQEVFVHDRSGLVGEFLTEAHSTAEYDWITWDLTGCEGKYKSFINIGYWDSAEKFHEQIGKYFKTSTNMEDFEYELRVRTVLNRSIGGWVTPHCRNLAPAVSYECR